MTSPSPFSGPNGRQFKYFPEPKTWDDSQNVCVSKGGSLARSKTPEINEFIKKLNQEKFWIGLTDRQEEGVFKWIAGGGKGRGGEDGEEFLARYVYWKVGEPKPLHYGSEQPSIETLVLGHSLICSLIRSLSHSLSWKSV